jgi:hypothetical protein
MRVSVGSSGAIQSETTVGVLPHREQLLRAQQFSIDKFSNTVFADR